MSSSFEPGTDAYKADEAFRHFVSSGNGGKVFGIFENAEEAARNLRLMDVFDYDPLSKQLRFNPQAAMENQQLRAWFNSRYAKSQNERRLRELKEKEMAMDTMGKKPMSNMPPAWS